MKDNSEDLFINEQSPLFLRLAEEMRNEALESSLELQADYIVAYNRTHHRHNR